MITLAWPWALLALPLPALLRLWLPPARPIRGRALRLPPRTRLAGIAADPVRPRRPWRLAGLLVWLLLVLAAARPQWLADPIALPVSGRDLILAVDISGSMEQEDYELRGRPATRLAVVKVAAARFIQRRGQDRIGLILFGSRPYVQTPLTYDRDTVEQMLREAVVGMAGRDTAIGDAIGLAVKRLREHPEDNRVLVLLTDGDNTAGALDPRQAAALAAESGVRIYTIGLGGRVGAQAAGGYRVARRGADLDPATLQMVASQTGGRSFLATDSRQLAEVYAALDRLEPSVRDYRTFRPATDLYPLPAGAALVLSALLAGLRATGRWTPNPGQPSASGDVA